MNNFDITKEEMENILKDMIIPQIVGSVSPQEIKQSYILGGQPGSGKSAFARELIKINKNIVFINGDDLRAYHPKYNFYLKDNDIEAADMTQAVCNFWIESLIQECIQRELNFIVEGTMRRKEVPMKTANILHSYGYDINIVAISTTYDLSIKSLEFRYQELKKLGQPARFTKRESHDEAYQNIVGTLLDLVSSNLFKNFFIYKREPGSFSEYIFTEDKKDDILSTFKEGRLRTVEEREIENPFVKEGSFKISIK